MTKEELEIYKEIRNDLLKCKNDHYEYFKRCPEITALMKEVFPEYNEEELEILYQGFNLGIRFRDRHINNRDQYRLQQKLAILIAQCLMLLDKEFTEDDKKVMENTFVFNEWGYCIKKFIRLRHKLKKSNNNNDQKRVRISARKI